MTPADAPAASVRLPFCDLNHLEVLEVGGGRARCATTVGAWLAGGDEYGIPAAVAALADMALMYACSTRATRGMMPVTATMRVELWTDPPAVGSRLVGEAEVEAADGDLLLVSGRIGAVGRTVASATIRSMLVPLVTGPGPSPPGASPAPPVVAGMPPPPTPPVEPGPSGAGPGTGGSHRTGRESSVGAGERAIEAVLALPAAVLAGLELVGLGEGWIDMRARPSDDLERTGGVLHGGAVPLLATLASSALLAATLCPMQRTRRLDLTADYLRPSPVGAPLSVTSAVVQQSRRLIKVHSEILGPDGRTTARIYEMVALEPTI